MDVQFKDAFGSRAPSTEVTSAIRCRGREPRQRIEEAIGRRGSATVLQDLKAYQDRPIEEIGRTDRGRKVILMMDLKALDQFGFALK